MSEEYRNNFIRQLLMLWLVNLKSLGQSEHNCNPMCITSNVVKSSGVILQIHVTSPFPIQYNVERSKELCFDGFNTVGGVGVGGRG